MGFFNQTWQDGKPACTDPILQVTMTALALGPVTNVYTFTSTFLRYITTKLGKIEYDHAMTRSCG